MVIVPLCSICFFFLFQNSERLSFFAVYSHQTRLCEQSPNDDFDQLKIRAHQSIYRGIHDHNEQLANFSSAAWRLRIPNRSTFAYSTATERIFQFINDTGNDCGKRSVSPRATDEQEKFGNGLLTFQKHFMWCKSPSQVKCKRTKMDCGSTLWWRIQSSVLRIITCWTLMLIAFSSSSFSSFSSFSSLNFPFILSLRSLVLRSLRT